MANGIGIEFKEKMWGYYKEGLYDPWRAEERATEKNETWEYIGSVSRVQFPPDLRSKIRYDDCGESLIFTGAMTENERQELLRLSKDSTYGQAIDNLFRRSQNFKNMDINVDLTINLNNFLGNTGTLKGILSYKGDCYKIEDGSFNLFTKDKITQAIRLEYKMPFLVNNQRYVLSGYKELYDDPHRPDLLEILEDLTTLFVTLYKDSKGGPMLGTGIMKYHSVELPVFISSLRATGGGFFQIVKRRNSRIDFIGHVLDTLRKTYSFLGPAIPPERIREKLGMLDRAWFGSCLAYGGSSFIYDFIYGKYLKYVPFVVLVVLALIWCIGEKLLEIYYIFKELVGG